MTHHISTEDPAPYGLQPAPDRQPSCRWAFAAQDNHWTTACGQAFAFTEGGPLQNGFRCCPFCGCVIRVAVHTDADADQQSAEPENSHEPDHP